MRRPKRIGGTHQTLCMLADVPPRQPPPRKKKDLGDVLSGPVRAAIFSTPARAVQNLQDVAKNTPIGIAVQRAMSGAQTFRNEGYASAVKQQAKTAAIDIAVNSVGGAVGRGIGAVVRKAAPAIARVAAKTNLSSELAPGQNLAFHFSNNPNLKVIKDVKKMRNQGGNFGQKFDSTKFTPPGSTYGYGPLQGTNAVRQVDAVIQEAATSREAAAAAQNVRQYTLYVTKTKDLKGAKGRRVKDPEYGFEKLAGDSGESVYGKQKPIAKIPLNLDSIPSYGDAMRSKNPDALALRKAAERLEKNRVQNLIANNPKIRRAGLKSPGLTNVHGDEVAPFEIGYTPKPFVDKPVKSVTQIIRNSTTVAPTVAKVAVSKKKNTKTPKKK